MVNGDIGQRRVGEALDSNGRLVKVRCLVAKGYRIVWICGIAANIADHGEFATTGVFSQELLGHELGNGLVKVDAVDENLSKMLGAIRVCLDRRTNVGLTDLRIGPSLR